MTEILKEYILYDRIRKKHRFSLRQIKTIVATGHDGSVYSLSIGNGKRVDRRISMDYNYYMTKTGNDTDLVMKALSEKYGWRYLKK